MAPQRGPGRECLVADRDGDVWAAVDDGVWTCTTNAGDDLPALVRRQRGAAVDQLAPAVTRSWDQLVDMFGPVEIYTPKTGDGAADAAQTMGGSLPPAVPSSPADCPCAVLTDDGDCTACGEHWESQNDKQTCGGCGDDVYCLSTHGLCDGCEAETSPMTGPGPAVIGGQPGSVPRRFHLYRHTDISHVSGIGVVAWGVQFPDGSVAVRWHGDHPSTVAWNSVEDAIAIHGHSGATEIRWLDDVPIDLWPAEGGDRG